MLDTKGVSNILLMFCVYIAHAINITPPYPYWNCLPSWNLGAYICYRHIKCCNVSFFICINYQCGENFGKQQSQWCNTISLAQILSLNTPVFTCSNFYGPISFLLHYVYCIHRLLFVRTRYYIWVNFCIGLLSRHGTFI